MPPRNYNPALFRENVFKSWKVMAHVVKHIEGESWIAHLEPNPGVGYDCLSLVVKDSDGRTHVPFMMNRNGVNSDRLDKIWAKVADEGHVAVAEELIAVCQLPKSRVPQDTGITRVCDRVIEWISQHLDDDFYVGPLHWPGCCETHLDIPDTDVQSVGWPIPDNGPDISFGLNQVEVERLVQRQSIKEQVDMGGVEPVDQVRKLALSIARCDQVEKACSDRSHDCHKIVRAQEYLGKEYRQSPEPWAGDLLRAKVLFVASNPSISEAPITGEDYPLVSFENADSSHPDWPEERIADFHARRFDQRLSQPFVNHNAQFLCKDGHYRGSDKSQPGKGSQTYWRNALKETAFILRRPIDISSDVCLTEVVHCKTKSETNQDNKPVGLNEALPTCAGKYLDQILQLASPIVIVISGKVARSAVLAPETWRPASQTGWDVDHARFGQLPKFKGVGNAHIGIARFGSHRAIVCAMRHLSNGYGCGSFAGALGEDAANRLAILVDEIEAGRDEVPNSRAGLLSRLGM